MTPVTDNLYSAICYLCISILGTKNNRNLILAMI